jgi:hypothetical protein
MSAKKEVSNVGQVGIDSIRIGGMTLQTLPIAETAITKEQWPQVEANAKRQEIEDILAEHPKQTIRYLQSRVNECNETIANIQNLKVDQSAMISDYTTHIGLCKFRDKEIAKLEKMDIDAEDRRVRIKELKIAYPPYDVKAMEAQIVQCKEAIERSDSVIKQEYDSIAELKEVITYCKIRDEKLKPYGVEVG